MIRRQQRTIVTPVGMVPRLDARRFVGLLCLSAAFLIGIGMFLTWYQLQARGFMSTEGFRGLFQSNVNVDLMQMRNAIGSRLAVGIGFLVLAVIGMGVLALPERHRRFVWWDAVGVVLASASIMFGELISAPTASHLRWAISPGKFVTLLGAALATLAVLADLALGVRRSRTPHIPRVV